MVTKLYKMESDNSVDNIMHKWFHGLISFISVNETWVLPLLILLAWFHFNINLDSYLYSYKSYIFVQFLVLRDLLNFFFFCFICRIMNWNVVITWKWFIFISLMKLLIWLEHNMQNGPPIYDYGVMLVVLNH